MQNDNITKSDLDITFRYLNEDVSLSFSSEVRDCWLTRALVRLAEQNSRIRVAKGKSGSDGKTFEYYICFDDLRDAGESSHFLVLMMLSTPTRSRQTQQHIFPGRQDLKLSFSP